MDSISTNPTILWAFPSTYHYATLMTVSHSYHHLPGLSMNSIPRLYHRSMKKVQLLLSCGKLRTAMPLYTLVTSGQSFTPSLRLVYRPKPKTPLSAESISVPTIQHGPNTFSSSCAPVATASYTPTFPLPTPSLPSTTNSINLPKNTHLHPKHPTTASTLTPTTKNLS